MTWSRIRGVREGAVLALAILLGPALALAGAPSGRPDVGGVAGPTPAAHQASAVSQPAEGSDSTAGSVAVRVLISPVTVRLELSQAVVRAGRSVQVRATVANESTTNVADVHVTIRTIPSGVTFRPAESRSIRRIAAGRTDTITWSACGQTVGMYSLVATAEVAGVLAASHPQQLSITAGKAC